MSVELAKYGVLGSAIRFSDVFIEEKVDELFDAIKQNFDHDVIEYATLEVLCGDLPETKEDLKKYFEESEYYNEIQNHIIEYGAKETFHHYYDDLMDFIEFAAEPKVGSMEVYHVVDAAIMLASIVKSDVFEYIADKFNISKAVLLGEE